MTFIYLIEIAIMLYLILFSVMVGNLMLFAVIGFLGRKKYKPVDKVDSFLILIPAHNEELGIQKTIRSLLALKHHANTNITVIADNCTDNTVKIATELGVHVLIRNDEHNRGKGYALEYAIDNSDLSLYDAVLIIDADTIIDVDAIERLSESFATGYGAIQLNNCLAVELDSPLSQLQHIANSSENNLFYKPRAILHFPLLLRGTGMAIKSEILQRYSWDSHSVTEDVDYSVDLLIKNIRIDYLAHCSVFSPATSSYQQSYNQKIRWASGTFQMIKSKCFRLLKEGFKQHRPELLELAFSLFTLSRPAMVYALLPIILISAILPSDLAVTFILWTTLLIILIVTYLLSGIFFVKNKSKALKGLVHIPVFAFWFFKVQLMALLKMNNAEWKRTERK